MNTIGPDGRWRPHAWNQRGAVSDLLSVGAVLYHVIAGRLPRSTIHELLTSSPIVRPRQHNPAVPLQLDELVMELLRDDPHDRLPTAAALYQPQDGYSVQKC